MQAKVNEMNAGKRRNTKAKMRLIHVAIACLEIRKVEESVELSRKQEWMVIVTKEWNRKRLEMNAWSEDQPMKPADQSKS